MVVCGWMIEASVDEWVLQICHQLRTKGDMSFEEISNVVPWIETAYDIDLDVDTLEQPAPRLFKTHAWRNHLNISDEAKYIVVNRRPMDAAVSFFYFMQGWFFEEGTISLDAFVKRFFLERGEPVSIQKNPSYWHFLTSWLPMRTNKNVLWLWYENMRTEHRETVVKIAEFLGFDKNDKDLIDLVVHNSTFDFMKENEPKFDEHPWKMKRNVTIGLKPEAGMKTSKVMHGFKTNRDRTVSEETLQMFEQKWKMVQVTH